MDKYDFAISTHFENINVPRKYNIRHKLIDIITIAICALVCGAQNWVDLKTSLQQVQLERHADDKTNMAVLWHIVLT